MKKYYKTSERIGLRKNIDFDSSGHAYSTITQFYEGFTKKDILDEADTIEELCDSLILVCEHDVHIEWPFKGNKEHIFEDFKNINEVDLGFGWYVKVLRKFAGIWTDEGLKYVAYLDEDKTLELGRGWYA